MFEMNLHILVPFETNLKKRRDKFFRKQFKLCVVCRSMLQQERKVVVILLKKKLRRFVVERKDIN